MLYPAMKADPRDNGDVSTTLKRPRAGIEAALRSDEPRLALRDECARLIAEGYSRDSLLQILEEHRDRLRQEGSEDVEDVVLDVMDLLDGWAGPQAVL